VKWIVSVAAACAIAFALTLALTLALTPGVVSAQEARDPLISPQQGGEGSRFQIVGTTGWTPGTDVTIRFAFTERDPLTFAGPFTVEHTVTVLRDGTWSFPVVVNDEFFPFPLGETPGFIVVQAESTDRVTMNAFVFTVNGSRPAGADAIVAAGFGGSLPSGGFAIATALFAAATGALLVTNGASRRKWFDDIIVVRARR
jgi:hypothetical protein